MVFGGGHTSYKYTFIPTPSGFDNLDLETEMVDFQIENNINPEKGNNDSIPLVARDGSRNSNEPMSSSPPSAMALRDSSNELP